MSADATLMSLLLDFLANFEKTALISVLYIAAHNGGKHWKWKSQSYLKEALMSTRTLFENVKATNVLKKKGVLDSGHERNRKCYVCDDEQCLQRVSDELIECYLFLEQTSKWPQPFQSVYKENIIPDIWAQLSTQI